MPMFGGFARYAPQGFDPATFGPGMPSAPPADQGGAQAYAPGSVPMAAGAAAGMGLPVASPAAKPGFFGRQGLGVSLLGGIGDSLRELNGMSPTFMPAMMQDHQQKALLDRQANQQALEFQRQSAEAQAKRQWDLEHPSPDSVTGHVNALNALHPGLGDTYAQNYANSGGSQIPQMMNIPGAGTFMAPRTPAAGGAGAPAAPPAEAIARLRSNPHEAARFDEWYGAGASKKYLTGGAAQGADVPFRQ